MRRHHIVGDKKTAENIVEAFRELTQSQCLINAVNYIC